MSRLTTSKLLASRQCQKRLWLSVFDPITTLPSSRNATEGIRLGEVARQLYGPGILISAEQGLDQAVADTAAVIHGNNPVFEATFQADGVVTRLDILRQVGPKWDIVEVKSGTSAKAEYLEYMAIQAYVCQEAGLQLGKLILAHVNPDFVYAGQGDYAGLLVESDVTADVMSLLPAVPDWIRNASNTLDSPVPQIDPGRFCKSPQPCDFHTSCLKESGIEYPVEILPNGWRRADALRDAGYRDLCDVPVHALTAESHRRVHEVSTTGDEYRDPKLASQLTALPYPRYYLDFETIAYAVPKWSNTSPHQAIPFQWSLHVEDKQGDLKHDEFLSACNQDPRESFLSSLLDVLNEDGPIIVYSSFEASRLKELADTFPDRATEIHEVTNRLVDLLPIVRDSYYAASMKGSFSIKKVLPALAPEVSYGDLDGVANGSEAMEAFDQLIELDPSSREFVELRNSMLAYCRLDTYAMVAVLRRLIDASCDLPSDG